jgi:predicted ArsR family transcriptional regulator
MQSTRAEILDYLITHSDSSAADLGRFLEMTPANIRYHLAILEQEGLVQVSGQRTGGYAGRPILLYNLTSHTLGENILELLGILLEALGEGEGYRVMLDRITGFILEDVQSEPGSLISSYNQAVLFLNDRHYRASWKATPGGPQIELQHCPYRDLAKTHPQLCQIDEQVISSIFNTELALTQKREFGKNPFSPCIFKPPTTA